MFEEEFDVNDSKNLAEHLGSIINMSENSDFGPFFEGPRTVTQTLVHAFELAKKDGLSKHPVLKPVFEILADLPTHHLDDEAILKEKLRPLYSKENPFKAIVDGTANDKTTYNPKTKGRQQLL